MIQSKQMVVATEQERTKMSNARSYPRMVTVAVQITRKSELMVAKAPSSL
jgi:hypothetical protein